MSHYNNLYFHTNKSLYFFLYHTKYPIVVTCKKYFCFAAYRIFFSSRWLEESGRFSGLSCGNVAMGQ